MEEKPKSAMQRRAFATSKGMSMRVPIWVAVSSASACALIWLCWGIYLYWNDVRLLNFLAAWIPFVLSVLLAFVPEHKMSTRKKILWRSGVITVGFIWSVVLWHQQVIMDKTAREDQTRIVTQAVTQSNEHSDQQIGTVRSDVQGVKSDVQGVKKDLEAKINDTISKSTSEITSGLSKVGKPEPLEPARVEFSLFTVRPRTDPPVLLGSVQQDKDGNFPVEVMFTNISDTSADALDVWIHICDQCLFATELPGFEKPQGIEEHSRHKFIEVLNPGTSWEKLTIVVKTTPKPAGSFVIGFTYSCKTCGKMKETQKVTLYTSAAS
jgi:hypothetical protein